MATYQDIQKILVVPDTQVKDGVDTGYLEHISNYIVEKQPDAVIHLGDHWDMPSLSSYDFGKKQFEGRRYRTDILAGNAGIKLLTSAISKHNTKQRKNNKKLYSPYMWYLDGNHDQRIQRAVNNDAKLDGTISMEDRDLSEWKVVPFLQPLLVNDVAFSHYFVTGVAGRPAGSARAQLLKTHQSSISGHQQGLQIATGSKADGTMIQSIIAGSCYEHEEEYLGPQGNRHFRGILVLHDVQPSGEFELMPVSLRYLRKKYA